MRTQNFYREGQNSLRRAPRARVLSSNFSGNKAWLRRRLHAAILCKQLRRERRARVQREWGGRERVQEVFGADDSDARSDSDS